MVSCGTLLQNPKQICQFWTVIKNFIMIFIITRHACHICIYLYVTVIFAIVACTINFFIETYSLSRFLIFLVALDIWQLGDHHIHIWNIFEVSVLFVCFPKHQPQELFPFPVYSFWVFFYRVISTSTKSALCLNSVFPLATSPKTSADINIKIISLYGWNFQWLFFYKSLFST